MDGAAGEQPNAEAPAVSVVVLNLNGEKLLPRCLDHLLAQTFENFEIIVVDNGSTDASLAAIQPYLASGKLSVVRAPRNLGVAAGRNLGALHARGKIIAFIDNDGYADPRWLAEIAAAFDSDATIGAVGSLVFFDRNKSVLNSAGGTVNFQGYGQDHCFGAPFEFVRLPREILYPMGCGMALRREVWRRVGPLDPLLLNYYDDVELGLRVWKSGARVVLAPAAIIDHGFSSADRLLRNKALLCERNRIRSVLKYYPLRLLPLWLWHELSLWRGIAGDLRALALRAGWWNLRHLPSALFLRLRFAGGRRLPMHLVERKWGRFPPAIAEEQSHADPTRAAARVTLGGDGDRHMLNFGWWPARCEEGVPYRFTAACASALFKFSLPVYSCTLRLMAPAPERRLRLLIRPLGSLVPAARGEASAVSQWRSFTMRCRLAAGVYELVLLADPIGIDEERRPVGVAVSRIEFE